MGGQREARESGKVTLSENEETKPCVMSEIDERCSLLGPGVRERRPGAGRT